MMTLEEVQKALQDRKTAPVAEATGLAYDTVRRVRAGKFSHISYDTVKALSDYMEGKSDDCTTD